MGQEKVTIQLGGRSVEAVQVEVAQAAERWNEYILDDGTVLKMKLVLKKVLKAENEFDGEGNPVYVMQSTNVTTVSSPKNLRRKDKE